MNGTSVPREQISRIVSVDVIRGLTILLMVFVNDLGPSAPSWLHHIQPPDADGMTLADIVFPFFLFIAGMSIPLAVDKARSRGQSRIQILRHVLIRSVALLLMGIVGVNRSAEVTLGPSLWGLLSYIAIILAWCVVPADQGPRRNVFMAMKAAGVVGLIVMAAIYRRDPVETEILFRGTVTDWSWLRTSWWGILGLIGWAYLICGSLYLLLGSRREWLTGALALLMLQCIVSREGGYFAHVETKPWLSGALPLIEGWERILDTISRFADLGSILSSLPAVTMAGCILGTTLTPSSDVQTPRNRTVWCLTYAAGLFVAGLMTDTFGGINKIAATPTWCFWCASLAAMLWLAVYLVVDVLQISRWTVVLRPAGANPLLAYLLHPIILFILSLTGLSQFVRSYADSTSGIAVAGSFVMAAAVCGLTWLLARAGLRLRV